MLEEQGVPEAVSGDGSEAMEGCAYVMRLILFYLILEYCFKPPEKIGTYAGVNFVYEHKADPRGATQVLDRFRPGGWLRKLFVTGT